MRLSWRSLARNRLLVQHGNQLVLLFDHYLSRGGRQFRCGRMGMFLSMEGYRVRILKAEYLDRDSGPDTVDDPLFRAWRRMMVLENDRQ